jgi:steroid delta-isomerase-like uncharacterized protein
LDQLAAHKAIVQRYFNAFVDGDLDALDEVLAPDVVDHTADDGQAAGIAGFREFTLAWKTAFPDLAVEINDRVAEGDLVVTRWTGRATHLGFYHGIPPTGKQITFEAVSIERLRDGLVTDEWFISDSLALLRQLGARLDIEGKG